MPAIQLNQKHVNLLTPEIALKAHVSKLKMLQRFWIPLQERAPKLVLILLISGVFVSLTCSMYWHWLFNAPVIVTLIIVEIIVDELQMRLLLLIDEKRVMLGNAATKHSITATRTCAEGVLPALLS